MNEIKTSSFEASILKSLPEPILWVRPVFINDNIIEDFEIGYSNKKADEIIRNAEGSSVGLRILKDQVPNSDLAEQNFRSFLSVYQTGETGIFSVFLKSIGQHFETRRTVFEGGVLSINNDKKDQWKAEKKEEESTQTLKLIVDNSPSGIVVYKSVRNSEGLITDFTIKQYNQQANTFTGFTATERETLPFKHILRNLFAEDMFDTHVNVVEQGTTFNREQYIEKTGKWLSISLVKFEDGFLAMLTDVTALKNSQKTLQEQSTFSHSILNASLNGIYVLEAVRNDEGRVIDFLFIEANDKFTEFTGRAFEPMKGKSLITLFPTSKDAGLIKLFSSVVESDKPDGEEMFYSPSLKRWYEYMAVKLGENSLVVTIREVTREREAALQVKEQKNILDNILKHSSNGITVGKVIRNGQGKITDVRTILVNDAAVNFTHIPQDQYLSKSLSELDANFSGSLYFELCKKTLETGEPVNTQYFLENAKIWLDLSISKMNEDEFITIFTDVTSSKEAQLKVEESVNRLAAVFNSSQSGMFTFTPVYNDQHTIIDFRFVITNPRFADYVNQTPQVLNGDVGSKWFPGYLENGVFDMYKTTFETGETKRIDIHYNVDGHDIYLDLMSTKVGEEVLVTFTDYTQLKKAQLQLEKSIDELKKSNVKLEEFAYAASHDLKEPIRKVYFYTDRLKNQLSSRLNNDEQSLFDRLELSAKRMASLVDDLLAYSHVSNDVMHIEEIDLNKKLRLVLEDLELQILDKNASIILGPLPVIKGYKRQIQQLFQNLVSNGLKYSKEDVTPQITVTSTLVTGDETHLELLQEEKTKKFYLIEVKDNGIGFEQKYADTIFAMFKRLHGKSEYAGTGIGLSIARKVVENHHGYIWAESYPDDGATFKVLLPA